jgi:hypothetical protein
MKYRHVGNAFGRDVFVTGDPEQLDCAQPQGYSVAAVVLKDGWKSDELGSLLNLLYGGIVDWVEFKPGAGARSFVFYGERSEEASDLCDAFAYAWTKGADAEYNDVIASSSDAADIAAFAESMLSGEIAVGDAYADKLKNTIFAVYTSNDGDEADYERVAQVARAVEDAVAQHRFE